MLSPAQSRARELLPALKAAIKKTQRLLARLNGDLSRHGDAALHRADGEWLKSVMHKVQRGMTHIEVDDGSGMMRQIPLDERQDGPGNLKRLFSRAKKAERAREMTLPRIAGAQERLEQLQRAKLQLGDSKVDDEVLQAAAALVAKKTGGSRGGEGKRAGTRLPYRAFRGRSGGLFLVGRSAKDNDVLTFKIARGNDLFFHIRDAAGSHVIVSDPGKDPPGEILVDGAHLALHFSPLSREGSADVRWARRKHLRKPGKGSPPGLVLVDQEKVIRLKVDPERIAALIKAEET
jgi:predicted ribosome quality control (RQC) complex YloA/Tae2 family protein